MCKRRCRVGTRAHHRLLRPSVCCLLTGLARSLPATYLTAICRYDSEVSRDPVPTFHLHQIADYDVFCVDAHLLAISNHKGLLWKGRRLTPLDGSQQGEGKVQPKTSQGTSELIPSYLSLQQRYHSLYKTLQLQESP